MQDKPLGQIVDGWSAARAPSGEVLQGTHVRLEPLSPERHAAQFYDKVADHPEVWTYMPWGPFSSMASFRRGLTQLAETPGYAYYAICDAETGRAKGKAAFMNVVPDHGVIEVGGIAYAPALQRTVGATEAMILMMRWAFGAGYRRYEWKCNALNAPSRRAAQRLGFSYVGVFRNHSVVKGRSRDTAWFAVTDADWPALSQAFDFWLSPENFDPDGNQRESLSNLTRLVRVASDPTQDG